MIVVMMAAHISLSHMLLLVVAPDHQHHLLVLVSDYQGSHACDQLLHRSADTLLRRVQIPSQDAMVYYQSGRLYSVVFWVTLLVGSGEP